ncbi:MAG: diphosphate--fructose-6-phosphate 1-phosphotransferase [bacterium]|nr:diphosphate--fructose-6-phosphate 1-phosphotransferase [bacterium]
MSKNYRKTLAIVVGGGPAPGINGVISAATIEAINNGVKVIGIYDGFKWLVNGDTSYIKALEIADVSRIHFMGGSIIRTSRENPTKSPEKVKNVVKALEELKVDYLITIGGDDTAFTSSTIERESKGKIKIAHVPKTIDNDLPLPGCQSTFGYQTARHIGTSLVQNIMEDSKTTGRWYFVISMGRKAGHLALGIGKAAGATLTIIGEEFKGKYVSLKHLCDIIEGAIIKRKSMGRSDGVAVLAEGLMERFDPEEIKKLGNVELDEFDNIRMSELDLGKIVKNEIKKRFEERGQKIATPVTKDIGYELRCVSPIPFDSELTRDLGFCAVKFLLNGGSGALINVRENKEPPILLKNVIDPNTGKIKVRYVDTTAESYESARNYMIRLNPEDFEDKEQIEKLAKTANLTPAEFIKKFKYLVE